MKRIKYFIYCIILLMAFACEEDVNTNTGLGESINDFKLVGPSNFSSVTLNPEAPDLTVIATWEAAKAGKDGPVTYRFLLDKVGGDFSSPLFSFDADDDGAATKATIPAGELKDAVSSAGIEEFRWTVEAKTKDALGENTVIASDAFSLTIKISDVGISTFTYSAPSPNQKLVLDKIRTPNADISFSWTEATSDDGDVKYTWLASTTPDGFDQPVIELESDDSGTSPTLTLTHAELTDMLAGITYTDGLYWRVEASVGEFTYYPETRFVWFEIFDIPALYVVGSFTNGWSNNCTDAIQLGNKGGGVFESLINIPAGAEFKFVLACGSWDVTWGNQTDAAVTLETDYSLLSPGANVKIADAGNYFIRADFSSGKFRVTKFTPPANMYLVGGATSAGWNPSASIPFVKTAEGKFEIFAHITDADGFKFLQVKDWAGDWGKGAEGKLVQEGEGNVEVSADGFYRITLDFTTGSYTVLLTNWGIVGSAQGSWDNDTDMTYTGDYTWEADITLSAGEWKFRANDGWDINFGSAGADNLQYNGGNFATSGGAYHIEMKLDPETGYKYTITPQ